jgi:hypothetical protein
VGGVGRRLAGIAYAHKLAKQPNPCTAEDVKVIMAGIRRTLGCAPKRKAAAAAERVRAMLDACPDTMIGVRDRALIALGFAGAFRRSELVTLQVSDLLEVADGYRVAIRRSKTDQTGDGHEIVVPRGLKIRPVAAVQAWLQAAGVLDDAAAKKMTCHALDLGVRKVAVLHQLAWLEGEDRYSALFSRRRLARIWAFSPRQTMWPGDDAHPESDGGMTAYGWFVFERDHHGPYTGDWLPGETTG